MARQRIGIIGGGISGLMCAYVLRDVHDVTLFEAAPRLGGHTNTVRVALDDGLHDIDTGFIVYNETNYPGFTRLLSELSVATKPTEMSFSVSDAASGVEWRGTSLRSIFAQRANFTHPPLYRMLVDVARFNRAAARLVEHPTTPDYTIGDFVAERRLSRAFVDLYLVPLGASLWSADPNDFHRYPAASVVAFLHNHGMLTARARTPWRTVDGGANNYVDAIASRLGGRVERHAAVAKVVRHDDSVEVHLGAGASASFDHVVFAGHSDQMLELLADPSPAEHDTLGAIRYQPNVATVHTDARMLPRSRRAWASWNYHRSAAPRATAGVTYLLNRLQGVQSRHAICVTLNRQDEIDPNLILESINYAHPVLDSGALHAQSRRAEINGARRSWYAGAYWGNGFHEAGVQSALQVCQALGVDW